MKRQQRQRGPQAAPDRDPPSRLAQARAAAAAEELDALDEGRAVDERFAQRVAKIEREMGYPPSRDNS
jgi:hypothetical protein